ncbi:MAG: winged helix-turn-helix domain-containing protein, partial [Geminicoccaceae bacterium]
MGDAARTSPATAGDGQGVCHFDGRTLDLDGHVLLDADGAPVDLTRGELALLRALARRPGHALTRDQLLDAISGRGGFAFDRSVDMMVARLRRKLGDSGRSPRLIVTVPGVGYRLAAQVAPGPAPGGPAESGSTGAVPSKRSWFAWRWRLVAAVMFVASLAGLVGTYGVGRSRTPTEPVTTVILPFA